MNERLVTLLGGLFALFVVVMLVWSPAPAEDEKVSRPTTEDRGKQGLAALKKWLETGRGVPVMSLRERYDALVQDASLPERGNLLITVVPHATVTRDIERHELLAWLAQGNTILMLAAADDSPPWSHRAAAGDSPYAFLDMLGFDWNLIETMCGPDYDEESSEEQTSKSDLQVFSGGTHPLTQDLERVLVHTSDPVDAGRWELSGSDGSRQALELLFREPGHYPVFWQVRVGEGTAWISRHSDLFGNATLGEADNARLIERLVNQAVAPGGRVIFDDMHQGISILYDPQAFFSDKRLFNTLMFLVGLWVVYLLGYTNRFIPNRTKRVIPDLSADTRAAGGVFARHVADHAVARRLLRHFHHEIRAMHHLPTDGEPAWDLLARNARIDRHLLAALQREQERADAHQSVNLVRLTHLMTDVREALQ